MQLQLVKASEEKSQQGELKNEKLLHVGRETSAAAHDATVIDDKTELGHATEKIEVPK